MFFTFLEEKIAPNYDDLKTTIVNVENRLKKNALNTAKNNKISSMTYWKKQELSRE